MRTPRRIKPILLLVAFLLLPARPALANVGVPLLAVTWPGAWMLLLPVVIAETLAARRWLRQSWGKSVKVAAWANVASAAIAVPLSWFVPVLPLLMAGSFAVSNLPRGVASWIMTLMSPFWLPPMAESQEWLVPLAAAFLCLPAYFASVWVERRVAAKALPDVPREQLRVWAIRGNAISYGAIMLGLLVVALVFRSRS